MAERGMAMPYDAESVIQLRGNMRALAIFALLPFVTAPALAQNAPPPAASTPSSANSGAGTPGLPGSKSGPTARPPNNAGATSNTQGNQNQDAAKVPGLPGSKSGPAVRPPSSGAPK